MSTIIKILDFLHLYRAASYLCGVAHRREMARLPAAPGLLITSRRNGGAL